MWQVKIGCRDRPGLLADICTALRTLPVTVTAASVTTTPDGKVQDAFEMKVHDELLSAEEVQCAVNAALYANLAAVGECAVLAGTGGGAGADRSRGKRARTSN